MLRVTLAQESSEARASQFRLQVVTPFYVAPATRDNLRALYLRLRNTVYEVRKTDDELSLVDVCLGCRGLRRPCDCSVTFACCEAAPRTGLDPPYNGLITDSGSTLSS